MTERTHLRIQNRVPTLQTPIPTLGPAFVPPSRTLRRTPWPPRTRPWPRCPVALLPRCLALCHVGLGELDADAGGDSRLLHGDAVEAVADVHGPLGVGDDDELGLADELFDDAVEAVVVGLVEGSVHFVEDGEGSRAGLENAHQQSDGGHGLFPAGHERNGLQFLAGGLSDDLNAAVEDVFAVFKDDVGPAPAEELAEKRPEIFGDLVEGGHEPLLRFLVERGDQLLKLAMSLGEVVALAGEEGVPLFDFFEFADGVEVDVAEAFHFAAEVGDLGRDLFPILLGVLVVLVALGEVDAHFLDDADDELVAADVGGAAGHLEFVQAGFGGTEAMAGGFDDLRKLVEARALGFALVAQAGSSRFERLLLAG
jgi:hypothetical protein